MTVGQVRLPRVQNCETVVWAGPVKASKIGGVQQRSTATGAFSGDLAPTPPATTTRASFEKHGACRQFGTKRPRVLARATHEPDELADDLGLEHEKIPGMALADTILTAISTIAVLATVWLVYLTLGKARETVQEAKAARLDAEQAAKDAADERRAAAEDRRDAAADRREEEHNRQRRRLERVGEMVEKLFWLADMAIHRIEVPASDWMSERNLLGHALVGLHDALPEAAVLLNCPTAEHAFGPASHARQEITLELAKLAASDRPDPAGTS